MSAVSGATRAKIKLGAFSLAKGIRRANNAFSRRRRVFLQAVLNGSKNAFQPIEAKTLELLKATGNKKILGVLAHDYCSSALVGLLRKGVPLPNALQIAILKLELLSIKQIHLPSAPRYRKPAVLQKEKEILEWEYCSLRLALKNARARGLKPVESNLRKEVESKAKTLAGYKRLLECRLVG